MMRKIAQQGIAGSFSHQAAILYFGQDNHFIGTKKFKEIFELIKSKKVDFGIIPIENTLAGSIYENYDWLNQYKVNVVGESNLKIEHHLLGKNKNHIRKVLSHPKALEQCLNFFEKNPQIEKIAFSDTATAAKYVTDHNDDTLAAIASWESANLYHLKILEKNIEDNKENFTRFLIITGKKRLLDKLNKCSLILTLPHIPGSLAKALKVLSDNNLNLTKIESRPILGKPFEYFFYIDVEFDKQPIAKIRQIFEKLKNLVHQLKILGFYKSARL